MPWQADENVLDDILGVVRACHEPVGHEVDLVAVKIVQLAESLEITSDGRLDELGLAR